MWSEVPELPGCMAHGQTQLEALRQANEAVQLWLETARQFGDPIPIPKGHRHFDTKLGSVTEIMVIT